MSVMVQLSIMISRRFWSLAIPPPIHSARILANAARIRGTWRLSYGINRSCLFAFFHMNHRPTSSNYTDWKDDLTPLTLWSRVCSDDADAWSKLIQVWTPCILQKCRKKGLGENDAADVTQLVLTRVFRFRDRFSRKGEGHRLKHWLLMIINQCVADHLRGFVVKNNAVGGDDHAEMLGNAEGFDYDPNNLNEDLDTDEDLFDPALWMRQTLATIQQESSESTWKIFSMAKFEKLSTKEISQQTGVSEGAIRVRIHGVMKRIREEGEGLFEEDIEIA